MEPTNIVIRGAQQHNLKKIDVVIPRNSFVVLTGVSGSGKSSLAFDTIFAEGQRRYVESLSSYARQFLAQMETSYTGQALCQVLARMDGSYPASSPPARSGPTLCPILST
jgi:excinuclease UvrABC ATPase subunit